MDKEQKDLMEKAMKAMTDPDPIYLKYLEEYINKYGLGTATAEAEEILLKSLTILNDSVEIANKTHDNLEKISKILRKIDTALQADPDILKKIEETK